MPEFQELTGIEVTYNITPEENYFDRITTNLFSRSGDPDVFMPGIYQMWDYAAAGYMEALDDYIGDPARTSPEYAPEDFFEGVLAGGRWSLNVGDPVGSGTQWTLPLGFEAYVLAYNESLFEERGLTPPTTLEVRYALRAPYPAASSSRVPWSRTWVTGGAIRGSSIAARP